MMIIISVKNGLIVFHLNLIFREGVSTFDQMYERFLGDLNDDKEVKDTMKVRLDVIADKRALIFF